MKKFHKNKTFTLILTCLLISGFEVFADFNFQTELTKQELESLNKSPLIKTYETEHSWPDVVLYQLIEATALESVAIFYALDYQNQYIPNLKVSQVIKTVSPTIVHTRYVMGMPWPLSDTEYIHASELSHKKPSSYKVKWWMVQSSSTDKVEGYAIFIPYKGKTLMKYFAHVQPKSFLATLVKNKMVKDVESSLVATRKAIEETKAKRLDLMKKYVSYIDQALLGKKVY